MTELAHHRRWPNEQMFVVEERRILFQPIAKAACTSLKRLMVELSDHPDKARILTNVHARTFRSDTGLLIGDKSAAEAERLLAASGFFRFVVLRDPLDRLVSAYVEKFVVNRMEGYQHYATGPIVAAVQGRSRPEEADHAAGITFRQFAEHVIATSDDALDPHWCAQAAYLTSTGFDHLYTVADLDMLARDLSAQCARPVSIGHENRSRDTARRHEPGMADRPPREIEGRVRRIATESFYDDPALRARVAARFAADHTLWRAAEAAQAARRRLATLEARAVPAPLPPARRLRKALSLNGLRRALGRPPVPRSAGTGAPRREEASPRQEARVPQPTPAAPGPARSATPSPAAAASSPEPAAPAVAPWAPAAEGRTLFFLHIPKTAGTALVSSLSTAFDADRICPLYAEHTFFGRDVAQMRRDYRFFRAHAGFRVAERYGDHVITVLRDPEARIISLYNYWRQQGQRVLATDPAGHTDPGVRLAVDLDFDAFLDATLPRVVSDLDNAQSYMIARSNLQDARKSMAGLADDAILEMALDNLRSLDAVGLTDDMPGFEADLGAALGLEISVGERNRTRQRSVTAETLSPAARARLAHLTRIDRRLVEAVRSGAVRPDPDRAAARRRRQRA